MKKVSRRQFLNTASALGGTLALGGLAKGCRAATADVPVYGHLWVYASEFPPDWDCTPILGRVFADFKYAGIEGVEVMESLLRNPDILSIAGDLIAKHELPIVGSSYNADMWRESERQKIVEDVELVVEKLRQLGGSIFGITVGDARRKKTEDELDAQAETLQAVMAVCEKHQVEPNIHNHTFEVENDLHDLKGILSRVPDVKLGPDLSWLAKAGVDPVWFVETYGRQMVYLHIRDNAADGRFAEAVGDGVIDFPAIAAALKAIDYRGRAGIELAYEGPAKRDTRENWKLSRAYVSKVFGW